MSEKILVKKYSGEKEAFDPDKLHSSLQRAGASERLIKDVEDALQKHLEDGVTTREIYSKAFQLLRKFQRSTAARYSLKKAIMELGPSGYPFEKFVGAVLESLGYEIEVGKMVQGQCIQHEVDVIAQNDHQKFVVECKYYNSQGKYCNVKVPLYIHSRFNDIEKRWQSSPRKENKSFHGWVVTNTRFTKDAMDYGKCVGLRMVSWDYPKGEGLKDMVEQTGLFPITVLTLLNRKQKEQLLEKGIVLCRQLLQKKGILDTLGLPGNKHKKVIEELEQIVQD